MKITNVREGKLSGVERRVSEKEEAEKEVKGERVSQTISGDALML